MCAMIDEVLDIVAQLRYYATQYATGDSLGREIQGTDEVMFAAAGMLEKIAKQNAPKYESIDDPAELKQSVARLKETPLAHMLARRFNATLDRKSVVRRLK